MGFVCAGRGKTTKVCNTYVRSSCSLKTMMILLEAFAVSTMQSVKNSLVVIGKSR